MKKIPLKIQYPGLKLFCLLLAFFTWQTVRENTRFESMVELVPVRVEVPEGWAVLEKSTDYVSVLFRGSREGVRDLSRDQVEIRIVLQEADMTGEPRTIELHRRQVVTTAAAKPVFIKPATLEIRCDRAAERNVPVKARLRGSLPDGLTAARRSCDPAAVRIAGPQQRISQIQYLWTEPVDLDGRTESFKTRARVTLPDNLRHAWIEPSQVSVEVVLTGQTTRRRIEAIPVRLLTAGGSPFKYKVEPATVVAELVGPTDELEAFTASAPQAFADCTGFKEAAEYQTAVQLVPGGTLRVVNIEPESVKVTVEP